MPKMEKRRPPENKRSRKPAHPVKREVSQELKNFAESTMNELLGWYGYDKLDLQDPEASDIRSFSNRARRHHVSVLKENSKSKPGAVESKVSSCSSASAKNGLRESTCFPFSPSASLSSPHTKDLNSTNVVVPFIKPSTVEEQQNIPIVCVWCQREGLKHYSLIMGSELKSFCSEKCFAMCRRAYFKRNKARDEDQQSDQSPPSPGQTGETPPRLKMNSNTRVCDWCKHVRHTKYLDFGAGEERLQFCSTKCLNQYKMDIFYRETQAALITTTTSSNPSHPEKESHPTTGENQTLLTPQSWDNSFLEGERKAPSPKEAPTPVLSSVASVLRSSSVKPLVAVQHQKEQEILGLSQLHSGRPVPQIAASQPCVHQNPPSFLQPPLHAQGLHSPVHQPPQNPASSPIQIPLHQSPQLQTPSIHSLRLPHPLYPHTGSVLPFAPMYRHPAPPPCPQPTVLVPYPIIIPLPVPVPIPILIPLSIGVSGNSNINKNCNKKEEKGTEITLIIPEDLAKEKMPEHTGIILHSLVKHTVKAEKLASPPDSCIFPFSARFSNSSSPLPTFQATSVTEKSDIACEHGTNFVQIQAPPDLESERKLCESDDVKENFSADWESNLKCSCPVEQTNNQTDQLEVRSEHTEGDILAADEEHTYAQSIPPKLREKNHTHFLTLTAPHTVSHTVMHTWDINSYTHLHDTEQRNLHQDAEPAVKRRCLRIRDQNK